MVKQSGSNAANRILTDSSQHIIEGLGLQG